MNLRAHARTHLPPQDAEEWGRVLSSRCIWRGRRATIREMLKDLTGLNYAIETRFQSRNSSLVSLDLLFLRDIKVEIFLKQRLYGVKYGIISASILFLFFTANSITNDSREILILFFLGVVLI